MSGRKSKKHTKAQAPVTIQNPVAANPLLGKSAAHGKTRKADRRANKIALRKMPFERIACPPSVGVQAIGSSGIGNTPSSPVGLLLAA